MDTEGELLRKSHSVARCAKASMLLLSLKQSPDLNSPNSKSSSSEDQENELMKCKIEDLRTSVVVERLKRRKVKLFGLLALILQIALLLSLWIFFLVMALRFY